MVRSMLFDVIGCLGLLIATTASAQCCGGMTGGGGCGMGGGCGSGKAAKKAAAAETAKVKDSFLSPYFKIWKALGADDLKGVPEAKAALASAVEKAAKDPAKSLSDEDRGQRTKLLASVRGSLSKLDVTDIKKAREGFGDLSGDLRKFVEAFPAEAEAYVVYCGMAKKSWLQDTGAILNPYYGASMSDCGSVVRKPGGAKGDGPAEGATCCGKSGEKGCGKDCKKDGEKGCGKDCAKKAASKAE
jgi:hypothetical protein